MIESITYDQRARHSRPDELGPVQQVDLNDAVQIFSKLDSCTVSDACDALQIEVSRGWIPPVWEGAQACGLARTTSLGLVDPGAPPTTTVHLGARAIERSNAGDIVVVANAGRTTMGGWGGLLSRAASLRGVGGVVVDGACRDVDETRDLHLPVFAHAGAVCTARGRVHELSSGEPVELFGHQVCEGDVVKADGTGVVVVPSAIAIQVAIKAQSIAERERRMVADLEAGSSVSAVMGGTYENLLTNG